MLHTPRESEKEVKRDSCNGFTAVSWVGTPPTMHDHSIINMSKDYSLRWRLHFADSPCTVTSHRSSPQSCRTAAFSRTPPHILSRTARYTEDFPQEQPLDFPGVQPLWLGNWGTLTCTHMLTQLERGGDVQPNLTTAPRTPLYLHSADWRLERSQPRRYPVHTLHIDPTP